VSALDRYEALGRGLYVKATQMVLRAEAAPVRALICFGRDQSAGIPGADYMAELIAAARAWNFPEAYLAYLHACAGGEAGAHRPKIGRAILKIQPTKI
jgi:hypothetical protein